MPTLIPYILEHRTFQEGGSTKVHILDWDGGNVLCGINQNDKPFSSGTPHLIDSVWLRQPDPDNCLCQKCKKSAEKLLNPIKTKNN